MPDLSIIIPAREEEFLQNTIDDILLNIRGDTEVVAILDGYWPNVGLLQHERLQIIHHEVSVGQRAATNEGVKISQAEFVMKCDAHCAFDEGFDVKLMADCKEDWTVVPRMYNLHAFNWKCLKCNNETYQGPTPTKCDKCDNKTDFEKVMLWKAKSNPETDFMRFDKDLKFQYWREFKKRPEAQGDLAPTLSLIGACWMMRRSRYWELDGMDESHGSWGQMGTEIACKSWLSGGQLLVNKKTWFAHMFRTQGGDFGFPYQIRGKDVQKARDYSQNLWMGNKWEKQKHPLEWLIQKFAPVPDWDDAMVKNLPKVVPTWSNHVVARKHLTSEERSVKGLVYYTDNCLDERIMGAVQRQLLVCCNGFPIVSVSLKPLDFGVNVILNLERSALTMFKQILTGLETIDTKVVFLVEHDILYHPSHFDFAPPRRDIFYYNQNVWKIREKDGQALFFYAKQTSGLCAYRKLLLEHYRRRVELVEKSGFTRRMGFEPGSHNRTERVDDCKSDVWFSEHPNIDIRHSGNLTESRFKPEQYRSQKSIRGWTLADEVPFWGRTKGRFDEILDVVLKS